MLNVGTADGVLASASDERGGPTPCMQSTSSTGYMQQTTGSGQARCGAAQTVSVEMFGQSDGHTKREICITLDVNTRIVKISTWIYTGHYVSVYRCTINFFLVGLLIGCVLTCLRAKGAMPWADWAMTALPGNNQQPSGVDQCCRYTVYHLLGISSRAVGQGCSSDNNSNSRRKMGIVRWGREGGVHSSTLHFDMPEDAEPVRRGNRLLCAKGSTTNKRSRAHACWERGVYGAHASCDNRLSLPC